MQYIKEFPQAFKRMNTTVLSEHYLNHTRTEHSLVINTYSSLQQRYTIIKCVLTQPKPRQHKGPNYRT